MIISPDLAFSMLTNHLLGSSPPYRQGCSWSRVSVEKSSTITTITCLSWAQIFSTNPDIHQPRQNLMFRQIYRSVKKTNQLCKPGPHQPIWTWKDKFRRIAKNFLVRAMPSLCHLYWHKLGIFWECGYFSSWIVCPWFCPPVCIINLPPGRRQPPRKGHF